MLSINTNLSSLIAQNSMNTSTNKLNQAIERMTTGAKINHAKDNAANYSINTNMTTKIGAYRVAEENTAMGMDMVATASENLDQMQNHATRLRALATQARNGTYGAQSLDAIQSEANALTKEIERLYSTAEYNGVKLFDVVEKKTTDFEVPTVNSQGFIKDIDRIDVTGMKRLSEVENRTVDLTDGEYSICDLNDLLALVELTNNGKVSAGDIFVMGADIDLGEYCDEQILNNNGGWTPIGDYSTTSKVFRGTFDGNGYRISNVKIDRTTSDYQGLFGHVRGTIKNLKVENVDIVGQNRVGGLAGYVLFSNIENNVVTGYIKGINNIGGGVGYLQGGTIIDTSSNITVQGNEITGGLIGEVYSSNACVINCFSSGDVYGSDNHIGGLIGSLMGAEVTNCYSTANVFAENARSVGGLIGKFYYSQATNCYSTGKVLGSVYTGGLVGFSYSDYSSADDICLLKNCYSTSNVAGSTMSGGLVGSYFGSIENCTFKGYIQARNLSRGGLIGASSNQVSMKNCSFEGDGKNIDGILLGTAAGNVTISDCQIVTSVDDVTAVLVARAESNISISNCLYNSYYEEKGLTLFKSTASGAVIDSQNNKACDFKNNLNMQVGINNTESSSINLSTSFLILDFSNFGKVLENDNGEYFATIDNFLDMTSKKQVELGSMQNRLESVLNEISTQYENLVSSRSTIRDADMAEVSSTYIQQQILQEASATLLATTKNIQYQNVLGLLQGLRG